MVSLLGSDRPKIAIIGGGIAGLSAAYFLRDYAQITIYEQEKRLGGHSRTIQVKTPDGLILVDTGFIVFNSRTYPNLLRLFNELGAEIQPSNMSFAASIDQGRLEWAGRSIESWFAQRRNIFSSAMWGGLLDVMKFNRLALNLTQRQPDMTVQELLVKINSKKWFRDNYLLPMAAAIWSCPIQQVLNFPAHFLVRFFHNHGLLQIHGQPSWLTLKNRSVDYVQRLVEIAKPKIVLSAQITAIKRQTTYINIMMANGDTQLFDQVIFACHPQAVLPWLADASNQEIQVLSKFRRHKNIIYTHSDPNWMPKRKKCWSSWNYLATRQNGQPMITVTYWMNKLQVLPTGMPVFVTLNPWHDIPKNQLLDKTEFYHPAYNPETLAAQQEIEGMQGKNRSWYAGAYLGYGFHEDGISSSLRVAQKMGLGWPS